MSPVQLDRPAVTTNQPATQVNMSCPCCGVRVVALVLDPKETVRVRTATIGGEMLRWYGRCSVCESTLTMSATRPTTGDDR